MLVDRFDGNDPQDVSHILRTLPINGCLDTTVQGPLVSHAMRTRIARTIQRDRHNGHASEELRFESALVLGMLRAIVARNPTQAVFPHMKAMNLLLEIATTQRRRSLGIKRYGQGYTDYPEHDLFRAGLVTWTGVDEQRRFVLDTPAVDALLAGTPPFGQRWPTPWPPMCL